MRLAIALYEQKKYTRAIRQLEKSLDFYPESPDAKSYLHYCYLFLGRRQEALRYQASDSIRPAFFQSIYFETGVKKSDEATSTRDVRYIFTGLNHEIGKRVSFFHGYQHLTSDFAYVLTLTPNGPGPGYGGGSATIESIYTFRQNEYYATLDILAGKGFFISPAYHGQQVKADNYQDNNYVFSIQLTKWAGKFKLYGVYYTTDINNQNQQQAEGGIVFYPMGNTNLYLQAQVTYHLENQEENLVFLNRLGIKAFRKTWLEGFTSFGDMMNYSEYNGLVVYNQLDTIKSRWGLSIRQLLGNHMLFISYIQEKKEEYSTAIPFVHQNIIFGLNLAF
jgi:tetratricopeptide (TPR) repeat protein